MTTDQINHEADGLSNTARRHQRLTRNKVAILEGMKAAGVTAIVASYQGAGDDGSSNALEIQPSGVDIDAAMVSMLIRSTQWNAEKGHWTSHENETALTLDEAIQTFLDDVIDEHHGGYENNEGGGGQLTFDVNTASVAYSRYDYVVEREDAGDLLL